MCHIAQTNNTGCPRLFCRKLMPHNVERFFTNISFTLRLFRKSLRLKEKRKNTSRSSNRYRIKKKYTSIVDLCSRYQYIPYLALAIFYILQGILLSVLFTKKIWAILTLKHIFEIFPSILFTPNISISCTHLCNSTAMHNYPISLD